MDTLQLSQGLEGEVWILSRELNFPTFTNHVNFSLDFMNHRTGNELIKSIIINDYTVSLRLLDNYRQELVLNDPVMGGKQKVRDQTDDFLLFVAIKNKSNI